MTTLLFSLWAAASAAEPELSVQEDGTVIARVLVQAPEARVRQVIPELQGEGVNSNVLNVVRKPKGNCEAIQRTTRGLMRPLELNTEFCPTTTGWRERLVSSSDFTTYEAAWTLRPQADGSTGIEFRVRSEVNLMVPASLLRTGTVNGVKETFTALLARLRGQSTP